MACCRSSGIVGSHNMVVPIVGQAELPTPPPRHREFGSVFGLWSLGDVGVARPVSRLDGWTQAHICIPFLRLASKVWTSLSFDYRGATRVSLVGIWKRDMDNSLEFLVRAAAYAQSCLFFWVQVKKRQVINDVPTSKPPSPS